MKPLRGLVVATAILLLAIPGLTIAATKCVIKGNVTHSGSKVTRIYHLPAMMYYKRVVIKKSEGDRWFCSERDAKKAGFRKSSR